jgi:hypothetical protein
VENPWSKTYSRSNPSRGIGWLVPYRQRKEPVGVTVPGGCGRRRRLGGLWGARGRELRAGGIWVEEGIGREEEDEASGGRRRRVWCVGGRLGEFFLFVELKRQMRRVGEE